MRLVALDLETTSVDTHTAEVVQCALVLREDDQPRESWSKYYRPRCAIPADASAVHGIYDELVAGCYHFSEDTEHISALVRGRTLVTFNGNAFDLPIATRILGLPFDDPHIDVYRVWLAAREHALVSPRNLDAPHAGRYTGALGSSFAWLYQEEPTKEHDAAADCHMTLDVCEALLDHYGADQCLAWSSGPLPGYVDYGSKIRWRGDAAVLTFGKHKGIQLRAIARADRNYLMWILRADFHESTKKIISAALDGRFPVK